MVETLIIALGLSMDAFAVSISSGMCGGARKPWTALRACVFFGGFQAAMPIAGWFLGGIFRGFIGAFDHWIAFALLSFIGGKMALEAGKKITENRKLSPEERKAAACEEAKSGSGGIDRLGSLTALAVATSIDALAVGLSLSLIGQSIFLPAAIIGAVTFAVCLFGLEFGKRLGRAFGEWAEILGGAALVAIGVKIMVEHLSRAI